MSAQASSTPRRRSVLLFLPLLVFGALAALFLIRLQSGDPSRLPSALIGKVVPGFDLGPLPGTNRPGLGDADLKAGHVSVVNVFASWCVECHQEHEMLMRLAQDPDLKAAGAVLDGLAYKDKAEDARRYLGAKGNPFAAIGLDSTGRTGIDFGVYGVPETFVVKGDGAISYKLVGGVRDDNLATLKAEIKKAAGS